MTINYTGLNFVDIMSAAFSFFNLRTILILMCKITSYGINNKFSADTMHANVKPSSRSY